MSLNKSHMNQADYDLAIGICECFKQHVTDIFPPVDGSINGLLYIVILEEKSPQILYKVRYNIKCALNGFIKQTSNFKIFIKLSIF